MALMHTLVGTPTTSPWALPSSPTFHLPKAPWGPGGLSQLLAFVHGLLSLRVASPRFPTFLPRGPYLWAPILILPLRAPPPMSSVWLHLTILSVPSTLFLTLIRLSFCFILSLVIRMPSVLVSTSYCNQIPKTMWLKQ